MMMSLPVMVNLMGCVWCGCGWEGRERKKRADERACAERVSLSYLNLGGLFF